MTVLVTSQALKIGWTFDYSIGPCQSTQDSFQYPECPVSVSWNNEFLVVIGLIVVKEQNEDVRIKDFPLNFSSSPVDMDVTVM